MAESRFSVTGNEETTPEGAKVSIEIRREPNAAPDDTVWGVAQQIVDLAPELLEQHRRTIEAKIKRLTHHNKLDAYTRITEWSKAAPPEWVKERVNEKVETHRVWSKKSDEEIVTW